HWVVPAAVLLIAGCSSKSGLDTVPIKGEVTYNGKPLADGTVVYLPAEGSGGRQATGPIQSDGTFSLTTQSAADGAMKGSYQIAVYAYKPHPGEPKTREEREAMQKQGGIQRGHIIPEKYTDPATSGLSDTVNDDHTGFKKLELSD
ncbi:MAG: hypothetical protein H0T51_18070, partial [Pirellulales bacterium]|nr:hypothetical protein [Pirellulales bacterium]